MLLCMWLCICVAVHVCTYTVMCTEKHVLLLMQSTFLFLIQLMLSYFLSLPPSFSLIVTCRKRPEPWLGWH